MFSLNGTLKKVGRSGDGKRNNLLGWPEKSKKKRLSAKIIVSWKKKGLSKSAYTLHVSSKIYLVHGSSIDSTSAKALGNNQQFTLLQQYYIYILISR